MKYKIVLFDIDDTLLTLESDGTWRKMFSELLASVDLAATDEQYNTFISNNHRLWAQAGKGAIKFSDVFDNRFDLPFLQNCGVSAKELDERFQNMQKKETTPTEGAVSCCQKLSEECDIYAASNGKQDTQAARVAASKLAPFLKDVYTSQRVQTLKPRKEFFDLILSDLHCADKKQVLMVGDTYGEDVLGAYNYEIDSCWLNPSHAPVPDSNLCTYQVANLGELPDLIL
ncbi:HAD family hydrolase [Xylocopilactobacillus apicola]|uniref:Noncanonical pyrimidine nucleotidase, YjjG family protein n=1 Tax=Xylocopilactobacillus apicola TaxID=2932184 RepID=A0AAU9DTZ1_9LACO|nr:HAD-IA family hydrolase [Xylocopilactobacillus apicola]BDR58913.1 noncanonical pyrimidine nucleotidase, YjjG family protein [Xylocopilactobacillus apicola]